MPLGRAAPLTSPRGAVLCEHTHPDFRRSFEKAPDLWSGIPCDVCGHVSGEPLDVGTVEVANLPRFVHAVRVTDGEGRPVRATVHLHTTKHGRSTLVVEVDRCNCPMSCRATKAHSLACPEVRQ
jgi:hypothetical protein